MENKTVLITGSSRGLGKDLSNYFINLGYNVLGLSRSFMPSDKNYTHVQVDISDYNELKKSLSNVEKIDLLINNAAIFTMKKFSKCGYEEIQKIIDINLKGTMYVTQLILPKLKENSKIVFINSVAGLEEIENQSLYCASKYGLTAFAGVLGKELRDKKIKVISIHPGGINTSLWNEHNPYPPGNVKEAMNPNAIVEIISHVVHSKYDIDYKTVKMFPSIEWH